MDGSQGFRQTLSWSVFLMGLIFWITVQGAFSLIPLWTRALPPEVDDSLSYVLKSRQMEECFYQDCPALSDLRKQLSKKYVNDHTRPERRLAGSRIFPVYHPLLSVMILGLKKLGLDWMTAYKVIWTVGPLFFGLAFAYLLASLWGLPAAGLALGLLAFKVFPGTGLHRVVPSNLAMAMAAILWARIISQNGKAMWALVIGSILMIAMHPIGRIYAVMAVFLALSLSGFRPRLKTWLPAFLVFSMVGLAFVIFAAVKGVELVNFRIFPKGDHPIIGMVIGASETVLEVCVNIITLEGGLFGSIALFCGAVAFGLLTAPWEKRSVALKTISIYALFLFALLFYVSTHPADVIFRMWIPLVIILFGALGQAIWHLMGRSWALLMKGLKGPGGPGNFRLQETWPVVVLALLLGYSFHMTLRGAEQVEATERHIQNCQPLLFDASQPELLLSQAGKGDRVLYTSMIIMPYYLIHGAMQLGAVYYHPSMEGTEAADLWLNRPDVRFAVAYHPTVYHPSFEGMKENLWWTGSPDFYFSPLSE
ncbi:MAG: hypothetical protein GY849_05725, partial [Deltaproteobacteria bacterium]|nr:hypothetical protein [Deltaproteobacteria bacterium]